MKWGRTTNGLQPARWSINLLLAAAVAAQTAYSQAAPAVAIAASAADRRAIDSARAIMLAGMRRSGIPGASVTVLRNGREIWSEGLGVADLENNLPVTPLTKFRIGSVSKPITAVAMAALVEEGKLDLDAPIQKYVPAFPVKKYPITARELAGHLAGIRHYSGDEFLSNRHYANVTSSLDIFKNDTLLFRPGDKYSYSTYGFVLLSAVVEGAAGEP
ncbi:MAG: serine hydrolase domain-containing protein, partial [Gemmatimonadaceae bacterium]